MRKQAIFIILISLVAIYSCRNENIPPANIISEFPNEIGDHWRYLYTWGIATVHLDTIDVDIVGTRTITGGQAAKVWEYKYKFNNSTVRDTSYVVVDSQLVKIYFYQYGAYYERKRYKLPLTVGSVWTIPQNYRDTTWVLGNYAVTVAAGTFANTYELRHEQKPFLNTWTNNKIWFSPQVGVIKFDQFQYDFVPVLGNDLWELISYTVH
jgi:hypothetical protein